MTSQANLDETAQLVVTYGWNRVAYNVLRSLSGRGVSVAVGDASNLAMSKKSNLCRHVFSYPSFYREPMDFIESLKSTFLRLRPKVYFPIHEETFVVAKYIHEFSGLNVTIPIHDFETLRTVHKKDSLNDLAVDLGIPVPRTFKPTHVSDLRSIWNDLKPSDRVVIKMLNTNSAKGVFYVSSYDELVRTYSSLIEKNGLAIESYPIVQEYVSGDGYGVSMLYNRGGIRARFTHKRLREKLTTGGTSTKRISVKNGILEEYAERLMTSLKWHGVVMVEFKFEEASGRAWMIEVNPRFWGSLALPIRAGVDFPYLLYRMCVDGDVEPVLDYKQGVVVRWLLGDVLSTANLVMKKKSLKPVADFLRFKNETFDDLYRDDMRPFFFECCYYLSKLARTLELNPTEEAMLDVDRI